MIDVTHHPYIIPKSTLCTSFSAAFTLAPLIRPPPMASHMFNRVTNFGTLFSIFEECHSSRLSSSPFFYFNKFIDMHTDVLESTTKVNKKVSTPRIAIIGGGIAGVTVASALVSRLQDENRKTQVILFEQDSEGGQRNVAFDDCQQPVWTAATARNANSMVPGAAMHVMSQRSTLSQIFVNTCQEIFVDITENIRSFTKIPFISNIDNFKVKPPYFALHMFRCIGPSASWDERMTFLEFMRHFLVISMLSGENEAHDRGSLIQKLAKSNRLLFLDAINHKADGQALREKVGTNRGFLSLHRTLSAALYEEQEGKEFDEASKMIPMEDAIKLEPRICNLPMAESLFAIHRRDDYTANSAVFVQALVEKIKESGVKYICGNGGTIKHIVTCHKSQIRATGQDTRELATSASNRRFKITTDDGITQNFDYVVLAAGVNTPILARKIDIENASGKIFRPSICPTYPLRGYSLTVYTNHTKQDGYERKKKGLSSNLLNCPISIDDMYCSSVGLNMARFAGFGELVGYREKTKDVPSHAPKVLGRYAKALFPESDATEEHALQCFRPMSPDDIPLVGNVGSIPGLYLHTGHGTLGWTLCLATAECVAQAISDDLAGREDDMYKLPGSIEIQRAKLSPDRFL